ncbi:hypothetical protein G6F56_013172 [Rhizopus delemar]|nr:hypothetical protein G6F56_013172 [Rhizopus delemar]
MLVHEDLSLGSDHHPVSLSCVLPPPPPPPAHPRLLWNLSRLAEPDCLYVDLFRSRIQPFRECLTTYASPTTTTAPDMDLLANELTSIIHSCLDDSVGQKKPRGPGNAWFWTEDLQVSFDRREQARRKWKRAAGINKALRWQEYQVAAKQFKSSLYSRRRATWKQFCETLSSGPLSDTTATIKRIRRNRTFKSSRVHLFRPPGTMHRPSRLVPIVLMLIPVLWMKRQFVLHS